LVKAVARILNILKATLALTYNGKEACLDFIEEKQVLLTKNRNSIAGAPFPITQDQVKDHLYFAKIFVF